MNKTHCTTTILLYFLVVLSPSGDTRGQAVVFEAVGVLYPGQLHLSHIAYYVYAFCLLSETGFGPLVCVRDVECHELSGEIIRT